MTIQDKRREVEALIDNIKQHSDRLKNSVNLPLLELSVILSKITQLHEKTLILKYLSAVEQHYEETEFGVSSTLIKAHLKSVEAEQSEEVVEEVSKEVEEEIPASDVIEEETEEVDEDLMIEAEEHIELAVETEIVEENLVEATDSEDELETEISEEQLSQITEHLQSEAENWEEIPAKPDVNEAFSEEEDKSVSEQLKKQPIRDLFTAIGINERYLYTNELFDGDIADFKKNIVRLNECADFDQASQLFNEELKRTYGWKDENELVTALYQLVERRFL